MADISLTNYDMAELSHYYLGYNLVHDGLLPYLNRAKDSKELTRLPTLLRMKR
jgi:hypothetical protein